MVVAGPDDRVETVSLGIRNGTEVSNQGRTLNPRLHYAAIDSPYAFASFGKNWSTYYKIAGMTDRFVVFGGETAGVYNV